MIIDKVRTFLGEVDWGLESGRIISCNEIFIKIRIYANLPENTL
jgi:hypothetical protein